MVMAGGAAYFFISFRTSRREDTPYAIRCQRVCQNGGSVAEGKFDYHSLTIIATHSNIILVCIFTYA